MVSVFYLIQVLLSIFCCVKTSHFTVKRIELTVLQCLFNDWQTLLEVRFGDLQVHQQLSRRAQGDCDLTDPTSYLHISFGCSVRLK